MARTNKGQKVYISTTAQNSDLANAAAYDALTYTEVGHVGAIGESGTQTNIVNYDELGTTVVQKQKGISDAGNPTIEVARDASDAGQDALRAAALTTNNYAFKFVDNDSGGTNGTTYYNRGLVTGPTRPNGRVEDFVLEVFTLGLQQLEIVKEAA